MHRGIQDELSLAKSEKGLAHEAAQKQCLKAWGGLSQGQVEQEGRASSPEAWCVQALGSETWEDP